MDSAVQKGLDDMQRGIIDSVSKEFADMRKALADQADQVNRVTQRLDNISVEAEQVSEQDGAEEPNLEEVEIHCITEDTPPEAPSDSQANSSHEDILRMMVNQKSTPFQVPPPLNVSILASDWQQWIVRFEQYRGA